MTQPDDFVSPIDAELVIDAESAARSNPMDELGAESTGGIPAGIGHTPKGLGGAEKLIQSKLAVLACLFLVTGFLGLPLLWMNRRFNTAERFLWAVVVIVYTLVLIGLVGAIVVWCYNQIVG